MLVKLQQSWEVMSEGLSAWEHVKAQNERKRNRCEINYSKSKCKALAKRISALSGEGFTSQE